MIYSAAGDRRRWGRMGGRRILQSVLLVVAAGIALIAVTVAVVGRERLLVIVLGPVERGVVDFQTLTLGERPNQYLVCPAGYCAQPAHAVAPVYDVPASALAERWLDMVARQPRTERVGGDLAALQYDFVQRSWLFRFPDTITVRFIALGVYHDAAQSTLAIYSRSHYGYSDLGVNRSRIDDWLAALSDG